MAICRARNRTTGEGHRLLSLLLEATPVCLIFEVLFSSLVADLLQLVSSVLLCRIPRMSWSVSSMPTVNLEKPLELPWVVSTRTSDLVASGTVSLSGYL